MNYIVAYDITNSKIRKELANYLISEKFIRIQKSIFLGQFNKKEIKRVSQGCHKYIKNNLDLIMIAPITIECLEKSYFKGSKIDFNIIKEERIFLF